MTKQHYPYYYNPYYYSYGYHPFPFQGTYYYNPYVTFPTEDYTEQYMEEKPIPEKITYSLEEQLNKIYEKLNQLEEENKEIKEELENKKTVNVENVNYKIQDLHVEDLSGALLVGLTTWSDAEELQELLAENGPVMFNDINTEEFQNNMMNQQNEDTEEEE